MRQREETLTDLLNRWRVGDAAAASELMPRVYGSLRQIAGRYLRAERRDHTLQATALVHECFIELVEQRQLEWKDRHHFVGVAAHQMRRLLVDHARRRSYAKRGGGQRRVALAEADSLARGRPRDLLEVDEALSGLASLDPRKAEIVELKFFGGMSNEEVAETLHLSRSTVIREWTRARAWLYAAIHAEAPHG